MLTIHCSSKPWLVLVGVSVGTSIAHRSVRTIHSELAKLTFIVDNATNHLTQFLYRSTFDDDGVPFDNKLYSNKLPTLSVVVVAVVSTWKLQLIDSCCNWIKLQWHKSIRFPLTYRTTIVDRCTLSIGSPFSFFIFLISFESHSNSSVSLQQQSSMCFEPFDFVAQFMDEKLFISHVVHEARER